MDSTDSEDEVIKNVEERNSSSETSYDEEEETLPVVGKTDGTLVATYAKESSDKMEPGLQPKPRRKRFVPKYEIEGVHIVILTEDTQILIEMLIGTDIIAQSPWKFVSKMKILESIDLLCEESEFYTIKEEIEQYQFDEVLMGYIVDESNDRDEFYICVTPEARDHCKQQSDKFIRRQEKKLEKSVQKKPGPWKSLGSEFEIKELYPVNTRPLIELEIKSKFPTEYDPEKFKVRDTKSIRDGYLELTPYRQKYSLVFKRRVDTAIQVGPPTFERSAQTELKYPKNMWTQCLTDATSTDKDTQGGGDATAKDEFNAEDDEEASDIEPGEPDDDIGLKAYQAAMNKLRRTSTIKRLNSFVNSKWPDMNNIVELNTVMDIYCNDYPRLNEKSRIVDIYNTMAYEEYVCFTDVRSKDKYVSSAVFHPMWTGIIAISYADGSPGIMKSVGTRPDPIARAVYGLNPVMIWSHVDTLFPKLYLESPREVKTLSFCPFNENILVGGCVNGQLIIWDLTHKLEKVETMVVLSETREKYRIAMNSHMYWMKPIQDNAIVPATALSSLVTSHYGPITSINWLSPNFTITATGKALMLQDNKKSLMLLTGSEDGTILVWNLSVENVNIAFEGKKVKKSKRVLRRPSGLLTDFSPFKVLDRNLTPCFRIMLGVTGKPEILPLQSFTINGPDIRYEYQPSTVSTGRKYFVPHILPQTEEQISKLIYCGSLHGELMRISWSGHEFNTGEVVNSEYCSIKYSCRIHDGIIACTKKNPFLEHITLTIGGKIFALWSDKLLSRPLLWKKRPHRLTDASWSLYKPSLFFITTSEGTLETWDLFFRSDLPISTQTLSGSALTGVSVHTLPLARNIFGVSDANASFKMFINPPIFMITNPSYTGRMESMVIRELKVKHAFLKWQDEWMASNPHVLEEIRRKEGILLLEKEEEKQRLKEEENQRLEEEAEARRLAKLKVIGPEERWQNIVQKLIERTIAVKKRINRAELIEQELPLRELEAQRKEKERRMLDIMKSQKAIFSDTVAILFPEAIKKKEKPRKTYLSADREKLKKEYLDEYEEIKKNAFKTVKNQPYIVEFSWENTLSEGRERREALTAHDDIIKIHKTRLELSDLDSILKLEKEEDDTVFEPIIEETLEEEQISEIEI